MKKREEALKDSGYSDDMGMFTLLDFAFRKGFKGRATRREFWRVQLALTPYFIVCVSLLYFTHEFGYYAGSYSRLFYYISLGMLVYGCRCYVGTLVRRMHDIGKSGWWCLLAPIPFFCRCRCCSQ